MTAEGAETPLSASIPPPAWGTGPWRRLFRIPRFALLAGLVVLAVASALAGVVWYRGERQRNPAPPEVPLADADPAVRRSVEAALQQVRQEPRSAHAWGFLGKVLRAHHFNEPAAACFRQAERLDGSDPRWPFFLGSYLLESDVEAALPYLRRAADLAEQSEEGSPVPRLVLAEVLFHAGQREEAEANFRRVLERDPRNLRAIFGLGMTALARDDLEEARQYFTRAAASPYARQRAHAQLAAIYQRLGDARAVAECLRQASQPPPDQTWPDPYHAEIPRLYVGRKARFHQLTQMEEEGRFDDMARLAEQLARDYPDGEAEVRLGRAMLARGQLEQAELAFRKALRTATNNVEAHQSLATVLYLQGERRLTEGKEEVARVRFQEAADSAARALDIKPNMALAHAYRGLALQRLGRKTEAIECLRTAVRCQPEAMETHLFLGLGLMNEGQWAEAEQCLQRAAERAEAGDSRPQEALQRLRAARARQPGGGPAKAAGESEGPGLFSPSRKIP
jgi:tetratricopeptide (TPR) repeat protein